MHRRCHGSVAGGTGEGATTLRPSPPPSLTPVADAQPRPRQALPARTTRSRSPPRGTCRTGHGRSRGARTRRSPSPSLLAGASPTRCGSDREARRGAECPRAGGRTVWRRARERGSSRGFTARPRPGDPPLGRSPETRRRRTRRRSADLPRRSALPAALASCCASPAPVGERLVPGTRVPRVPSVSRRASAARPRAGKSGRSRRREQTLRPRDSGSPRRGTTISRSRSSQA
jgi:hypothetical protein